MFGPGDVDPSESHGGGTVARSAPVPGQVTFNRRELNRILDLYGRKVAAGEWRDYAIDFLKDRAVFSIFRRTSEVPLYRIEKDPKLALLQAWLAQSQHRYSEVNTLLERAERTMREQKIEIDQTLHAEFDALRAQVAINAGKPGEAERLATEALKFLPLSSYYSRIVATSVTLRFTSSSPSRRSGERSGNARLSNTLRCG